MQSGCHKEVPWPNSRMECGHFTHLTVSEIVLTILNYGHFEALVPLNLELVFECPEDTISREQHVLRSCTYLTHPETFMSTGGVFRIESEPHVCKVVFISSCRRLFMLISPSIGMWSYHWRAGPSSKSYSSDKVIINKSIEILLAQDEGAKSCRRRKLEIKQTCSPPKIYFF